MGTCSWNLLMHSLVCGREDGLWTLLTLPEGCSVLLSKWRCLHLVCDVQGCWKLRAMDFLLILCRTLNRLKKKEGKKKRPELGVCSVFPQTVVLKANAVGFMWDCSVHWLSEDFIPPNPPTASFWEIFHPKQPLPWSCAAFVPFGCLCLGCGTAVIYTSSFLPALAFIIVFQSPVTLRWRQLPFLGEAFLWQKHLPESSQGSTCPWKNLLVSFDRWGDRKSVV